MTTVCQRPGFVVSLADTAEPRIHILRMDISEVPVDEDLDAVMLMISTFITHHEGRLVVHARHVGSDALRPPNLQGMMTIVGRLMDLKTVVDTKLKGTLVQAQCLDEIVLASKTLFLSLYQPRKPFDIVVSEADVANFIDGILAHEAEKRLRRDARP